MGLLDWTERHFEKARPWKPEGCSLIKPTKKWMKKYEDWKPQKLKETIDACRDKHDSPSHRTFHEKQLEKLFGLPLVAVNPHGIGRFMKEERKGGGIVFDIPFRFAQELVFDRDDGYCVDCRGCGHYLEKTYRQSNPNSYASRWTQKLGAPVEEEFRARSASNYGRVDMQVHHILPVSKNGSNCSENLKLLDSLCHRKYTTSLRKGLEPSDPRLTMKLDSFTSSVG